MLFSAPKLEHILTCKHMGHFLLTQYEPQRSLCISVLSGLVLG